MKQAIAIVLFLSCIFTMKSQVNTDRVMAIGRNALYFEDFVLSIQYFNQVIKAKPWMAEPYLYRAIAKLSLDDFKGAEEDCSLSIVRNPFLAQAYHVRGIARQSMEMYDKAIEDYNKGLEFKPDDRSMMSNKAIAYVQKKDFTDAENVFEDLIRAYPNHSLGYLTRGAMYLEKGDTAKALTDYDKAVEIDPYYAPCYGNRAIVLYQTNRFKEALADLNEAIRLNTRESGYYINRGLVRYQMYDLRGAMADYDQVIDMDGQNLIARFNRGLLRMQVGDNNRAIEDFDIVLEQEPNNYMAYYNRALLNYEVGNYKGAVNDLDIVLKQYPRFLPGYYSRADAKRKLNDLAGADNDYLTAMKLEQNKQNNTKPVSDQTSSGNNSEKETKTREESDKNIEKFNRLVIYDKGKEQKSKYQSDIRGRVQDRKVHVDLEPQFILTYYEKNSKIQEFVYYDKTVEKFNARMALAWKLLLTNKEAALTEEQIAIHFASINEYSAKIEKEPTNADLYFGRAIDFMLVQDFSEAIRNFDKVIELDSSYTLAYFNRATIRYKQMEYNRSQTSTNEESNSGTTTFQFGKNNMPATNNMLTDDTPYSKLKEEHKARAHELIIRDYDMVIEQNPGFIYSYYNRGNMRCAQRDFRAAISDYNEAILRNPEFAEAYFNRGLAQLSQGNANQGIADLSKAGELGILSAYSIIKRMTANNP